MLRTTRHGVRTKKLEVRVSANEIRRMRAGSRTARSRSVSDWIRSLALAEAARLAARTRATIADRVVRRVLLSPQGAS